MEDKVHRWNVANIITKEWDGDNAHPYEGSINKFDANLLFVSLQGGVGEI